MRLGIDLMGGEQPPQAIFEAVLQVSKEIGSQCAFSILAHHQIIDSLKAQYSSFLQEPDIKKIEPPLSLEFIGADEVIESEDNPLVAVRRKKQSTMVKGIMLLKERYLSAFVSTGNTGALMASALFHLPLLPTIERPALLVVLPAKEKGVVVLDVGANLSCKPEHLLSYARMGIIYRQCVHHISHPKVGLLNIGTEEEKGTKEMKEAYQLFQSYFEHKKTPFLGNVEGREVFQEKVDVLLTDGFTGNVFLKTCEGVSSFLMNYLYENFAQKGKPEVRPIISHLQSKFLYSEQPGALLCGVEGIVIKCHGYSDIPALVNGIKGAFDLSQCHLISRMKERLLPA